MYTSRTLLMVGLGSLWAATAAAQSTYSPGGCMSCQGREYKLVYQTYYEPRQVTAYRIEYDTVYEERQETRYRPVWETQLREHRYTVAKPVVETSEREVRYLVTKPVYETEVRDESYNQVRYMQETAEREERYLVSRPVWETAERQECYTVNRPVVETTYQTRYHTVMQPVMTEHTQLVDQGCYADQVNARRGLLPYRLSWQPATCAIDPATGLTVYQRAGLYWTPNMRYEVARVWQPNVVAQQVQQVQYVPQTVAEQVPVQVCNYRPEQVCRTVPYQVCRMIQEERVQRIPYTVSKPVVERVERKVPYQVCRMITEEQVQKVPVQTCRLEYEQRIEQVPEQVCRMLPYQETVRVPHCVQKQVPVTYNCTVPHTTCCRVPLDDCCTVVDECLAPALAAPGATETWSGSPAPSAPKSPQPTPAARPKTFEGTNGNGATEKAPTLNEKPSASGAEPPPAPPVKIGPPDNNTLKPDTSAPPLWDKAPGTPANPGAKASGSKI